MAYRSSTTLRTQGAYVRSGFVGRYNYFNAGWYAAHPRAWRGRLDLGGALLGFGALRHLGDFLRLPRDTRGL